MSSSDSSEHEIKTKKSSRPLVQPRSTKKRAADDIEREKPTTKKLKKELKALEKDQEESMFYRPEKKPVVTPKKEENASRRGNSFSDGEICFMLGLLYAGHDNTECTKKYFERYPSSSRTQQSVKTKFNWLRTDAISKISGVPVEKVESHEDALEFIKPSLVTNGDDFYLLFSKAQWPYVRIGFKGPQMRFVLTQTRKVPDSEFNGATFDGLSSFVYVMEIGPHLEFVGSYETDHYKGAQLKLKPIQTSKADDDWEMH